MEIIITPDVEAAASIVADIVEAALAKPHPILGLATGSSPLATYRELIRRHEGGLSLAHATAFLLDEYIGLEPGHAESYRSVIGREFTDQVDIDPARVHAPGVHEASLPGACGAYEEAIRKAGGVDVQLLGIGNDGHIGFNEPTSSLGSRTRIKTLTESSRRDNARFFDDPEEVPHHVLTQGIGTILESRHLVLVATGASKAEPIALAVEGPLTAMMPASALQLHPRATIVVDEAAASKLKLADYYRDVFARKPSWQTWT